MRIYRIAQVTDNPQKRREYQFDNKDNADYKVQEREEAFNEDDVIRVYHGFRDMNDAVMTAQNGISGADKAQRVYSYESNNNPYGLFVTTDLETAKEFTIRGAIIEFDCRFSELEIPVWPGGGYTVQGQMSQSWDWDKIDEQRQNATLKERERAKGSKYPAIANSSRPELAEMLLSAREYQALFVGNLNPGRINSLWVQGELGDRHRKTSDPWAQLTKDEFLEKYKYAMQKDLSGKENMSESHRQMQRRVFSPEDEFDSSVFLKRLSDTHRSLSVDRLVEMIQGWGFDKAERTLSDSLWPKQISGLRDWLQTLF